MDKFDLEELVMGIIVNAGMARSLSFEALQLAKKGEFDKHKSNWIKPATLPMKPMPYRPN